MKRLEARDQLPLGISRCVRLALAGMGYRLARSLTTTAILAVAVAFLTHIAAFGLIEQATVRAAWAEIEATRQLDRAYRRSQQADTPDAVRAALAGADADRLAEYQAWAGLSDGQLRAAAEAAKDVREFEAYLNQLPADAHAAATRGQGADELLRAFAREGEIDSFRERLGGFSVEPPPSGWDGLTGVRQRLTEVLEPTVAAIVDGHAQATASLGETPPAGGLENAAGLIEAMDRAGFRVPAEVRSALPGHLRRRALELAVSKALQDAEARSRAALRLGMPIADVTAQAVLLRIAAEPEEAEAWGQLLGLTDRPVDSSEGLRDVARRYARLSRLQAVAGDDVAATAGGGSGAAQVAALPARTLWLIGLSLMVCVVGVANAMLMSVTERFTEIATMKCLGAMDGSVLGVFVTEALFQGLLGGVAGVVLGLALAALRGVASFGGLVLLGVDALESVLLVGVVAGGAGVLLAVAAAVGPSVLAARLAPMEAMRVE